MAENGREPTGTPIRMLVDITDRQTEIHIHILERVGSHWENYMALHSAIQEGAYFLYDITGRMFGKAVDFWLEAERIAWSAIEEHFRRLTEAPRHMSFLRSGYEEFIVQFGSIYPFTAYVDSVRALAYHMWTSGGLIRVDDSLRAAQKHVLAIMSAAARTTSSAVDVAQALAGVFATFSPHQHLEYVRQQAYALWESAGRHHGHALDDWLRAEEQILEKIASGQHRYEPAPSEGTQSNN